MTQSFRLCGIALCTLLLLACDSGGSRAEDTSQLCGILSACCTLLDTTSVPAPGCATVADAGDGTLCGLGLEGVQAQTVGLEVILTTNGGQCGTPSAEVAVYPDIDDPACIALKACSKTLPSTEKATAELAYYLDEGVRCTSALAYFKSLGSCGSVPYDAGPWNGLLPLQGDGTAGMGGGGLSSHSYR